MDAVPHENLCRRSLNTLSTPRWPSVAYRDIDELKRLGNVEGSQPKVDAPHEYVLCIVSCASSTDEDTAGWLKGLPVSIEATPIVGAASGSTPDIPLDTPTTSPHHSRPGSTRSRNTIPVTEGITNHLQTPERKDEHGTLD